MKNLLKRRGVTEGSRLSFRREDLVGERSPLAGDDEDSGGSEGGLDSEGLASV